MDHSKASFQELCDRMGEIRAELAELGWTDYPSEDLELEQLANDLSDDFNSTDYEPARRLFDEWLTCIENL